MEIFFRGEPAARPYSGTSMVTSMNHQGLTPEDEKSPLPPFSKKGGVVQKTGCARSRVNGSDPPKIKNLIKPADKRGEGSDTREQSNDYYLSF